MITTTKMDFVKTIQTISTTQTTAHMCINGGKFSTEESSLTIKKPRSDVDSTMSTRTYSYAEVSEHCDETSCWMVVSDRVYDVTKFLSDHPGGPEIILENAGTDATGPFVSKGHSTEAYEILRKYCIGELVEADRRHKKNVT